MRNRAKCRLCNTIVESFHPTDYVECNCGEISVEGGTCLRCSAKDWANFLRIDENDNEIIITVKNKDTEPEMAKNPSASLPRPSRNELIGYLDEMIAAYERLPDHARYTGVTQSDLAASLMLLSAIFKAD